MNRNKKVFILVLTIATITIGVLFFLKTRVIYSLGCDYAGQVLTQSITAGEINNNTFKSIWNDQVQVNIWMHKVD